MLSEFIRTMHPEPQLPPRRHLSVPAGRRTVRSVSRSSAVLTFVAAVFGVIAMDAATCREAAAEAVRSGNVTAELVSEHQTIRPGGMFTLGVSLRPDDGWHTYWRNSGDSGLPTKVEWTLPERFHAGDLLWPHPVKLGKPPYVTFGYEKDALLLTHFDTPSSLRAGSDVTIGAAVRWLACRDDACVPGKADLTLKLRVDEAAPQPDARWQPAFAKARSELPKAAVDWSANAREQENLVRVEITSPPNARPAADAIRVFPLEAGVLDASSEPKIVATDGGFAVEIARDERKTPLPDLLGLVLVTDAGGDASSSGPRALHVNAHKATTPAKAAAKPGAVDAKGAKAAKPAVAARPAGTNIRLWLAVVLAFAGGLILNLMPCVFPVLSLKILGFVHVAHHEPRRVRWHGYAFAAGVVASFWILAGILVVLRSAGTTLGWGFQLQQPLFVAFLAALLLAMALNLFGVFEIGSSVTGRAGRFDSSSGYSGSFLSGVLATVLATPCSAPFMGTAIGYALVQPALKTFIVFSALGAGMALPYLVLACVPMLMRRLPRPGPWMVRFREAMAFPLLATVAWLVWVFGQQTGNDGVLGLLLALLIGAAGLWIGGRFASSAYKSVAAGLAGACMVAAVAMIFSVASPQASAKVEDTPRATSGLQWHPWDPDAIVRLRTEGRVVLVDFTADWCLSCKVNERVALSGDAFLQKMTDAKAIAMKADWTSADPRITKALADFGRSGVPLYVVYPRDPTRAPIVLPQILTPAIVHDAIAQAVA